MNPPRDAMKVVSDGGELPLEDARAVTDDSSLPVSHEAFVVHVRLSLNHSRYVQPFDHEAKEVSERAAMAWRDEAGPGSGVAGSRLKVPVDGTRRESKGGVEPLRWTASRSAMPAQPDSARYSAEWSAE
jgi:hypothetical protein